MLVHDYMTETVVTANLRDGLHQTYRRMLEREVRHMPVLGGDGELVGIISERDLRRPDFVDPGPNRASTFVLDNQTKVERAMTADPVTVASSDEILVAVDVFIERRFGALPVVDGGGRLVGMLSTVDALRALREQHG